MLDFGYIGLSFIGILVACILLLSFVMLASRWIKNYIISFTLQAWLLGAIALIIGIHLVACPIPQSSGATNILFFIDI